MMDAAWAADDPLTYLVGAETRRLASEFESEMNARRAARHPEAGVGGQMVLLKLTRPAKMDPAACIGGVAVGMGDISL